MIDQNPSRPITPLEDFEKAIELASLPESELELISYIRYTGVFSQPMIVRDLRLDSKPPVLSVLLTDFQAQCQSFPVYKMRKYHLHESV